MKIEEARETLDETERKGIYSEALDLIMELAVELPTYQRDDLFAYNVNKIDSKTLNQDLSEVRYESITSYFILIEILFLKYKIRANLLYRRIYNYEMDWS